MLQKGSCKHQARHEKEADRCLALLCQSIGLTKLEAGADDAALFRAGGVVDVGGRDEGAVVEEFEIGVAAVGAAGAWRIGGVALGVVEKFDAILAFAAVHDVIEGADPCDVVSVGGAFLGHVAEGDDEAAIGSVFDDMAIPGERGGEFLWFAPGACVVVTDRIQRVMLAGVFAHERDELFAVIGPRHARLCPLARDDKDDALLAPRQAAIERLALPDDGMQILGIFWIATVRPHDEPLAAIEGENALRGDFANEAEFLHRRPCFAMVRGKGAP